MGEAVRELAKRGALAVLNIVEQAGNMYVRDFSNCGVPCFNVGTDDGRFLVSVLEKAGASNADVRSRIALDTEMLSALQGHNTVGMVRGKREDEIVIVNAHADGWFDAAGDNGDGLAVLIALARHFATAPTLGLARTKQALQMSGLNTLEAQLDLERDFMRELGRTADYREGVAAFIEKRAPRFTGA